jgi:hypothetical protein
MNKLFKTLAPLSIAAALVVALAACSWLDVVQKDAVRAFGEILNTLPADEYEPHRWKITAPDGEAWFIFDGAGMAMVVNAAPFIAAGLDISKLENAGENGFSPGTDSIRFSVDGFEGAGQDVKDAALDQFAADVKAFRKNLGYHAALDHYNIDFGGGNMFEWAKDLAANDKDIVFVLNPEPLVSAGLDPGNVEGWAFAKVSVEIDGKPVEVDKLLKPFDLK